MSPFGTPQSDHEPAWTGWFVVRVTGTAGGSPTGYTAVERWNLPTGAPTDKAGGRRATALDPAYPVVAGQTFAVNEIALMRPAAGEGGTRWELSKGPAGGGCFRYLHDLTVTGFSCSGGAVTDVTVTKTYKWVKGGVVYDEDPGCP